MQFYLAPLEGVTGYIVRNAFAHHFPYQCHLDKVFYDENSISYAVMH